MTLNSAIQTTRQMSGLFCDADIPTVLENMRPDRDTSQGYDAETLATVFLLGVFSRQHVSKLILLMTRNHGAKKRKKPLS
jgi:hypothetical protein